MTSYTPEVAARLRALASNAPFICRMNGKEAEATAADLRAALAELDSLKARVERLETDARRYQHLKDRHSYHYGMEVAEPSPAEWGIEWQYQQTLPGEQHETIDSLIDAEIAHRAASEALDRQP